MNNVHELEEHGTFLLHCIVLKQKPNKKLLFMLGAVVETMGLIAQLGW